MCGPHAASVNYPPIKQNAVASPNLTDSQHKRKKTGENPLLLFIILQPLTK